MAHVAQQVFCTQVKDRFPKKFQWGHVLDVGSLDINGSNRFLFENCAYVGIDVGPGKNVDIVCPVHELGFSDGSFDVIVSTECFEHDRFYEQSLQTITRLLAREGLFLFSCAGFARPEHGTNRCDPDASPYTHEYYKNLTEDDVRKAIDVDGIFKTREFSESHNRWDLYFWGVKR